jgi:septum formation protein
VVDSGVHEGELENDAKSAVLHLAEEKARVVANAYPDRPVVGADTLVAIGPETLGKPADRQDAVRMLRHLSGQWHSVYGGVCILWMDGREQRRFVEQTRVRFKELSTDEIEAYVNTGESMDKAGAYGIQGVGSVLVAEVRGCFYNVMGLPVSRLVRELRSMAGGSIPEDSPSPS